MDVDAPSSQAQFTAIVREVRIEIVDLAAERSIYHLRFANDAAEPLSFRTEAATLSLPPVGGTPAGNWNLPPVSGAELTQILASQVTVSTGIAPPAGGGFEVRRSDQAWGMENDRNLIGRFTAQTFSVPRLAQSQSYYLRQYDAANPPNYSRDSTLLRVDWLF